MVAFVNEITLTDQTPIPYPSTATSEAAALKWLVDDDPLQFSPDTGPGRYRLTQRYALATLYYATNGDEWDFNTDWLSDTRECSWFALDCFSQDFFGVVGRQDYIAGIHMDQNRLGNNLVGTLPHDFGLLSDLLYLDLEHNFLSGTLPESIGNLRRLQALELQSNQLTGTLPESITNWNRATVRKGFHFENNGFVGSVPDGICQHLTEQDALTVDCELECSCCTSCLP